MIDDLLRFVEKKRMIKKNDLRWNVRRFRLLGTIRLSKLLETLERDGKIEIKKVCGARYVCAIDEVEKKGGDEECLISQK